MSKKTDCKGFFVDVIASIDSKRLESGEQQLTIEEKKVAWHVWQICWSQVRTQLRKEQKDIEKKRKYLERKVFNKEETIFDKIKKTIGVGDK